MSVCVCVCVSRGENVRRCARQLWKDARNQVCPAFRSLGKRPLPPNQFML